MPRSQRTNLVKTGAVETEQGKLSSGVVTKTNVVAVTPKKDAMDGFLEGLGLAAKGATTIMEDRSDARQKREAVVQKYSGIGAGYDESRRLKQEAIDKKLTPAETGEFFAQGMNNWSKSLKKQSSISAAYLQGGLVTLSAELQSIQTANNKILTENAQIASDDKTAKATNQPLWGADSKIFVYNSDGVLNKDATQANTLAVYKDFKTLHESDVPPKSNADLGTMFIDNQIAIIHQMAEDDPAFKWKDAVDGVLSIAPDGQSFAKHPEYGKKIDTLVSSLKTLAQKDYTSNKAIAAENKRVTQQTISDMLLANEPASKVEAFLTSNNQGFTGAEMLKELAMVRGFNTSSYASSSDPVTVNNVRDRIAGIGEPISASDIIDMSDTLTSTTVIALNKELNDFAKAIKSEKVVLAKQTYADLVKPGASVAGQENPYKISKTGILQKAVYIKRMVGLRNNFLTTHSWAEMDYTTVMEWDDIAQAAANKIAPKSTSEVTERNGQFFVNGRLTTKDGTPLDQ